MSGQIILAGGEEFQKGYESPDKKALELAGGVDATRLFCRQPTSSTPIGPAARGSIGSKN